jgi:putative OmpL-like beta-barrel porin-2
MVSLCWVFRRRVHRRISVRCSSSVVMSHMAFRVQRMCFALLKGSAMVTLWLGVGCASYAQDAPTLKVTSPTDVSTPADASATQPAPAPVPTPTPLPTPSITGPLQAAVPINFEAGPLGKLSVNGVVSGFGLFQSNAAPGNNTAEGAFSNAQVFFQKPSGWFQFYVQAGAYDVVSLGSPFISNGTTNRDLWGPVPVAYVKLAPGKSTNIQVGMLPTLMGAEYTFSFQNMNIERGLLWNQENAITRGVQVSQTWGKFTAAFSWNDGFYSNRYSGLSGALTYTNGPHTLLFGGMGYAGQTAWQDLATPVQNNGTMYFAEYSYVKGKWILQPYLQYSSVPTNPSIGVVRGASTWGGAILASRSLKRGFSVAGRWEYIASTGSALNQAVNLMYGPGSAAWSLTVTPTYQYKKIFTRADISFVQANNFTAGAAFGPHGTQGSQTRGLVEMGVLF